MNHDKQSMHHTQYDQCVIQQLAYMVTSNTTSEANKKEAIRKLPLRAI